MADPADVVSALLRQLLLGGVVVLAASLAWISILRMRHAWHVWRGHRGPADAAQAALKKSPIYKNRGALLLLGLTLVLGGFLYVSPQALHWLVVNACDACIK